MLYYIDKNWYHFIKEYLQLIFIICFSRTCWSSRATKQTYFGSFTRPQTQVLGYTTVTYLVAGTEIKFEVTENALSLLMKNNIMHVEKYSCQ